jgi:hypothetical protein
MTSSTIGAATAGVVFPLELALLVTTSPTR